MNTFATPIRHAAKVFGRRPAMVDAADGVPVTFGELARRVEQVAGLLDEYCVPAGGRVAVHADSCQRYAWLYAAIPAAGRVIVPLNTRYTATELGAAWQDCSPSLLFTDRPAEATAAGLATSFLPIDQQLDALLDAAAVPRFTTVRESEIAAIFYTGGTTDRAKGVALTHRNKLADAQSLIIELSLAPDDVWLVMSPMFHAAGSFNVLPCVWRGALQVFLPRFAPPAVLAAVERFKVSITFGVPTMLDALAEAQLDTRCDVSSLRLIGHGGAPLVGRTLERVCVAFPDAEICAQYGATEMAPLATVGRHQERTLGASTSRSAGSPVIGVDVSIQDPGQQAAATCRRDRRNRRHRPEHHGWLLEEAGADRQRAAGRFLLLRGPGISRCAGTALCRGPHQRHDHFRW